jgi:outer membrane protein assembly factor BamD
MNLPIPTPTAAQLAASTELENSRGTYHLTDNVRLFFLHTPDTVLAPHSGDPTLVDPKATVAPTILKRANDEFRAALLPETGAPTAPAPANPAATNTAAPAEVTPAAPAAPLSFTEVPTAGGGGSSPSTGVMTSAPAASRPASGNTLGVEILSPNGKPATGAPPNPAPEDIVKPVGPPNSSALPPAEKAADAPDTPNTITGQTNAAGTGKANGKNAATPLDKKDESSSKTKKKKGLEKLIPPL